MNNYILIKYTLCHSNIFQINNFLNTHLEGNNLIYTDIIKL